MSKLNIFMLIGPSSTGKTSLAREITGQENRIVAVNDRDPNSPFTEKISWREVKDVKNCAAVVEDLIALNKSQFDEVKHLLNFKANHHGVSPVVLITHSIVANGMTQLLPYVTSLVFSASPSCLSSLKRALGYYGFSKEEIEEHLKFFKNHLAPYKFFELGVISRTFRPYGVNMDIGPLSDAERKTVLSAQNLFQHLRDPKMAQTIFELILPHVQKSRLNKHDLSVVLRTERTARPVKISLVDYIDHLTDDSKSPSDDIYAFHSFLKRNVLIPESLIKNKKLENDK